MKKNLTSLALLSLLVFISGCTTTADRLYRTETFANKLCGTQESPVNIDASKIEGSFTEKALGGAANPALGCSIQSYNRDSATTQVNYDLAFVEILDSGEMKGTQSQIDSLYNYIDYQLKKDEALWVYVFVHGWRHNADIGDENIAKFHTMLALSKNHLNQQNLNTKVLGVYVGWRGKLIKEVSERKDPDIKNLSLSDAWFVPVALSFPGRKLQSDNNASLLKTFLDVLEKKLKFDGNKQGKLITIGHSLGGNMLLRAVTPKLKEKIDEAETSTIVKGFGDLVVLLNPASELRNWEKLQNFSRTHAGIASISKNSYLESNECDQLKENANVQKCRDKGTHHVYPEGQLPVVISLTSAVHFKLLPKSKEEKDKLKLNPTLTLDEIRGKTDTATSTYFPISQRLSHLFGSDLDIKALGQVLPKREWNTLGTPNHKAKGNLMYGLSHEIEINQSLEIATNYNFALSKKYTCSANRITLSNQFEKSILEVKKSEGRGWNNENIVIGTTSKNKKPFDIILNVKHGVVRGHCSGTLSEMQAAKKNERCALGNGIQIPRLGHAREPYWNVATHQNTIDGHGGYVSSALWCFVNGLVIP